MNMNQYNYATLLSEPLQFDPASVTAKVVELIVVVIS